MWKTQKIHSLENMDMNFMIQFRYWGCNRPHPTFPTHHQPNMPDFYSQVNRGFNLENTKNSSPKHGNLKNTNFEKLRFWSDFHIYQMQKHVFEANLFSFCKHEKRFKNAFLLFCKHENRFKNKSFHFVSMKIVHKT